MLTAIFLKKEGKDISSQISLEFAFKYRKENMFIKILKLHSKWKHKNHFWRVFNNKIVATAFLGLMHAMHTDPKSEADLDCQSVSQLVSQCVTLRTRRDDT